MAIKERGSVNPVSQPGIDSISAIRSDLETERAKVNSLVGALGVLAEGAGDQAPLFYTLLNALEPVDAELDCIIDRLITLWRATLPADAGERAGAVEAALGDWWPRTFDEWSAAVAENDGNGNGAADTEDELYSHMLKCHTTTAGDAALKMRVVLHSLFVSDARSQFPGQCAALSDIVADLERIAAAGNAARRAGKAVRS